MPDTAPTQNLRRIVALNVAGRRARKGLLTADLATASGLPLPLVHRIERADANPTLRTLKKVAEALDCTLADLVRPGSDEVVRAAMHTWNTDAEAHHG